jgi:hypothetical protein
MKKLLILLVIIFSLTVNGQVYVGGHVKSNGTYVEPYIRSSPNSTPLDNYSYPGNTNPYTGKTATGNPDTYLEKYKNYGYPYPSNTEGENKINTKTYYVNTTKVNVRSSPNINSSIITSLGYGEDVEVIEYVNENWIKVNMLFIEEGNDEIKSNVGYVFASYLSTPNNNSKTAEGFLYNLYHQGRDGNGKLCVWTPCSEQGIVTVYIDDVYKGVITSYYNSLNPPKCGDNGTLNLILLNGTYKLYAYGENSKWNGYITITGESAQSVPLIPRQSGPHIPQ